MTSCTAQSLATGSVNNATHEPGAAFGSELDGTDRDAAGREGLARGVDVLDDEMGALGGAGLAQRHALGCVAAGWNDASLSSP